jgi:hypothetical protein
MKVKIKSFNGELPSYLTEGKEYYLWHTSDMWTRGILADNGHNIVLSTDLNNCWHLNGGSWEILE